MTLQEKRTTMLRMVEQWHSSGIPLARFANKKNIPASTFRYWVYKSDGMSKDNNHSVPDSSDFIQLTGNGFLPDEISKDIRLQYPNGVSLSMPIDTPIKDLKKLINF